MAFPAVVDDDGTGTTGTVLDKAFFDAYNVEIAARDTTAGTIPAGFANTGNIDLALPAAAQIRTLTYSGTGGTLRGVTGAASVGDLLIIKNIGAGVLLLAHLAGIAGTQQLTNVATSAATPLAPGGAAAYYFTGPNWHLLAHEQGAWITPAYSAANFLGSASMTWTVDAGDVSVLRWLLRGRTMHVAFRLDGTSVGGTVSTVLQITNNAFGAFLAAIQFTNPLGYCVDNGVNAAGFLVAAGSAIQIIKSPVTNWTLSTNGTILYGEILFEVN